MDKTFSSIIFVFMAAFLVSYLMMPLFNKIALMKNILLTPDKKQKWVTDKPVIAFSGLVIPLAFTAALFFSFLIMGKSINQVFGPVKALLGFFIGGLVIFTVGVLHDMKPIPRRFRFIFYILAAFCAVTSGISIFKLAFPFNENGWIPVYAVIGYIITVLWILFIMLLTKQINKMEYYQSGIIMAAFFATLVMGMLVKNLPVQIIAAAMMGVHGGFLPYNLNRNMNIMGETGSVFTGYTIAVLSILGSIKTAVGVGVVIPFILIGFPVLELIIYFIKKLFKSRKNTPPVLGSLYFRMKQSNCDDGQVMLAIILINLVFSLSSYLLLDKGRLAGILFALAGSLVMLFAYRYKIFLENRDN